MDVKNIAVATVYTNLGDDAVVHALKETGTEIVVTSHELLPRFRQMLPEVNIFYKISKHLFIAILPFQSRLIIYCNLFQVTKYSPHNLL